MKIQNLDFTDPTQKLLEGDQSPRQGHKGPKTTKVDTIRAPMGRMSIQPKDLTTKRSRSRTRIFIISHSSWPLYPGLHPHKSGGTLAHLYSPVETGEGTVGRNYSLDFD